MTRRRKRRSRSSTRSWSNVLWAALLTLLIWGIVLAADGFVPFGVNTPAVTDAKLQYLDLFSYYRDVLTGHNAVGYTFSSTLGGSAVAIWAYYLASPFNLLVLLFPKEQMNLSLEVLIAAKLCAASAAFAWFLERRFTGRIRREIVLILSVSYGLMQYTLAQGSNVMWLDGVILLPFIVLGVHGAVHRDGKRFVPARLALPAAVSVLANWYTGGINYLFSAVWFLYEEIRKEKRKEGKSAIAGNLGRYAMGMGIGLLIASVLFVPNVLLLRAGKAASWNPADIPLSPGFRGNPLSVLRSYRIGERSDITRASFFCGTMAMFGTAAYFLSGRIRRREKAAALVPLLVAWMACFWKPLFYIFSLFMTNTSYWYRFGYLGCFVLLYLAAYWAGSLPERGRCRSLREWSVIPKAGGLCLVLILLSQRIWPSGGSASTRIAVLMMLAVTVLLGLLYVPGNYFRTPHAGKLRGALVALCLLEAFLETRAMLRIYHSDTAEEYASYSRQEQAQIRGIRDFDKDGFYRISQTSTRITNIDGLTGAYLDAMAYGYASVSGYTSCPENRQLDFLDRLGYRKEYDSFNIVNTSLIPVDSLLGVRYVLSSYEMPGLTELTALGRHNQKAVFENPYALPPAMILGEKEAAASEKEPEGPEETGAEGAGNPFLTTERIYGELLGEKAGFWTPVPAEKTYERIRGKGRTEWTLTAPEGNYCLYGNLPWKAQASFADPQWWDDAQEQGRLTVAPEWAYGYGGWLSPSVFYIPASGEESGADKAQVVLETEGDPGLSDEQFYALDLDRMAEVSARIRANSDAVRGLTIVNGRIACDVTAAGGERLLLAVPASEGWTARINGQKTQIRAFEGCLSEIVLEQGENHITMQYRVPGLAAGILLSAGGSGLLAAWTLFRAGRKKKERIRTERTDI